MNQEGKIGRLFVVGCPRSGTTLLQCLLGAHSQIISLPETAYFADLISGQRSRRLLGIASPAQKDRYKKFLSIIEDPDAMRKRRVYEQKLEEMYPNSVREYEHSYYFDMFVGIPTTISSTRCRS